MIGISIKIVKLIDLYITYQAVSLFCKKNMSQFHIWAYSEQQNSHKIYVF